MEVAVASLNSYKKEVKDFLDSLGDSRANVSEMISMLEKKFEKLKIALGDDEISHELYDVLFLLFEFAAEYDINLDREWENGMERKKIKYLKNKI